MEHIGDVVAAVELETQRNAIGPPCRIDPDPLGNDRLIEIISDDVVAVVVADKQFGGSVHFFVVDPVLAIRSVLNSVLDDIFVRMSTALKFE